MGSKLILVEDFIAPFNELIITCNATCTESYGRVSRNFTTTDPLGASLIVTPLSGYIGTTNFFFYMLPKLGSKVDYECSYGYYRSSTERV